MGRKRRSDNFTISEMYCTECGNKGINIPRSPGQMREPGHLKNLYCIYCQRSTNHCEIRPVGHYTLENFKEEFELGRFVNGKKNHVIDLIKCSNLSCKYNRHGDCWNDNYSYDCPHRPKKEDL